MRTNEANGVGTEYPIIDIVIARAPRWEEAGEASHYPDWWRTLRHSDQQVMGPKVAGCGGKRLVLIRTKHSDVVASQYLQTLGLNMHRSSAAPYLHYIITLLDV